MITGSDTVPLTAKHRPHWQCTALSLALALAGRIK